MNVKYRRMFRLWDDSVIYEQWQKLEEDYYEGPGQLYAIAKVLAKEAFDRGEYLNGHSEITFPAEPDLDGTANWVRVAGCSIKIIVIEVQRVNNDVAAQGEQGGEGV